MSDSVNRRHEYLFVYGSLRRGRENSARHLLTAHSRFVGGAAFNGVLYDLGMYPAAVPSDQPDDWLVGELYELGEPQLVLSFLDAYEGCNRMPPLFRRAWTPVSLQNGEQVHAWVYLYARRIARQRRIQHGDYLAFLNRELLLQV